jgi:thymidine kinase
MSTLELIFGPMYAGKTCELIRRIRILKVLKQKYIIIKPSIDNRYIDNMIVSHNFDKEECTILNSMKDIYTQTDLNEFDYIFIDEAQFFNDLTDNVITLVEKYKKNVVVAGLVADSSRNTFGQITDLIRFGAKITQLEALCLKCMDGTKAISSHRISESSEQIKIGSDDIYISVCRKHYMLLNNL